MRTADLIRHEWRTTLRRPAALAALALLTSVLVYGAASGRVQRDARLQAIAHHRATVAGAMVAPPRTRSAMDVTLASCLPPAPLGDFAIGQSDLLPQVGAVSLWNPDVRLLSRYELADPVAVSLGAFDLGKAIVLVLPLVLIVLGFDALSCERDADRLGLLLAQGARLPVLLWGRLSVRLGAAIALTLAISLLALSVGGPFSLAQRLPSFAIFWLGVALYAAFWTALIGFVAAGNRRGEWNVLLLLVVWAGLTLLLPAAATTVAEAIHPAPSRLTLLARARELELRVERAEADAAHALAAQHQDVVSLGTTELPAYLRTAFLVTSAVDRATGPALAAFDQAAAHRDRALARLRYVSPAVTLHGLFSEIAGTSAARHRRYHAAVRALKAAFAARARPSILAGRALTPDELATLPSLELEDDPPGAALRRHAAPLLVLALLSGLLVLLASRRLRRISGP
jgi:ABC-2 type transport system permease protein